MSVDFCRTGARFFLPDSLNFSFRQREGAERRRGRAPVPSFCRKGAAVVAVPRPWLRASAVRPGIDWANLSHHRQGMAAAPRSPVPACEAVSPLRPASPHRYGRARP